MPEINRLHYITQDGLAHSHLDQISMAVDAGLKWVQLRAKNTPPEDLEKIINQALLITRPAAVSLIVNDYLDLALRLGAEGVHLGQSDGDISKARAKAPLDFIIGATCNTFTQIKKAKEDGADYIGLGPYRFTRTKKNLSPVLGRDSLEEILKEEKDTPIIIIGGLQLADFKPLFRMGAYGVALSSLINMSKNPFSQMLQVKKEVEKYGLFLEKTNPI